MILASTLRWVRLDPAAVVAAGLCLAWIAYIIVLAVRNARGKDSPSS